MKEEALKMIKKKIKEYDTDIDIRVLIDSPAKNIISLTKKESIDLSYGHFGFEWISKDQGIRKCKQKCYREC